MLFIFLVLRERGACCTVVKSLSGHHHGLDLRFNSWIDCIGILYLGFLLRSEPFSGAQA